MFDSVQAETCSSISANPTKFKKKTEKLRTLIKFNIKESEIIIHVSEKTSNIEFKGTFEFE